MTLYATRWEQSVWARADDPGETKERLIVIEASSVEEAQTLSGMVVEDFHEATEAEIDATVEAAVSMFR